MDTSRVADWNAAPDLLEGSSLKLGPDTCGIEYWLRAVAQGTWKGQIHGHEPGVEIPSYLLAPGPLRSAVVVEFAFRTVSEDMGTRAISHLVRTAPNTAEMEFFATQLLDEARHASVFRQHLVDLGIPAGEVASTIDQLVGDKREKVLVPLEQFALETMGARDDYIMGVLMLTVIVEGVLAPASELSERKWRVLDPPGAQTARGANIDEVRHLAVGAAIVHDYVQKNPNDRPRLMMAVGRGLELWKSLPIKDVLLQREMYFQEGMHQQAHLLADYEIMPGRRLIDTGIEERMHIQMEWSKRMQMERLAYMGLVP